MLNNVAFKNILFDLDGTIIEPQEGIINAILYALEKMGQPLPPPQTLTYFIGPPLLDSFQNMEGFSSVEAEQAVTFFRVYYAQKGIYEHYLYDGISELLHTLHQQNYKLFIATSKPTIFAQQILAHHNMQHLFTGIVGSTLDHSRSNKTDIIRYVLETYQLHPKETLMIGDRVFDVEGAKSNGLPVIGVTYGHGDRVELEAAKANDIVSSVGGLKELMA